MANNTGNLKPVKSKEEARERGRKGGIASGKSKRARKTLKEELLLLLANGKTQQNVTLALIERALSGDVKAFEVIRDTIGEKPVEKVESQNTVYDMSKFSTEELKKMLDDEV